MAELLDNLKPPAPVDPWQEWKATPGPEANAKLLDTLNPVIDKAITAHVGKTDPLMKSRARILTLRAAQTYEPGKSEFATHVHNHLQGLKRYNAQMAQPVKMPERAVLDMTTLQQAGQELKDELGREATDDELADRTGMNHKRIHHVRQVTANPMMESFFARNETEETGGNMPAVTDSRHLWLRAIHDDLSPVDQKIMDWTLGGVPNATIALRLKLSPGRVSQRKQAIQKILDTETNFPS